VQNIHFMVSECRNITSKFQTSTELTTVCILMVTISRLRDARLFVIFDVIIAIMPMIIYYDLLKHDVASSGSDGRVAE